MKLLFALISLLFLNVSFSQKTTEKVYKWDEVLQANPDTVYNLSLSKMKLTELPAELWHFKNLRKLYLDKNKLSALPDSFDRFSSLEFLSLDHNQFELFPMPITRLKNLKTFIASNNRLTYLPDNISNAKNLQKMDFYNNEIADFGKGIYELEALNYLDISGTMYGTIFQKQLEEKLQKVKIVMDPPCKCLD
jgi:Leucine-rich repeat (LRR) protein